MQLICNKKELLGIRPREGGLTFYQHGLKILAKTFCQFSKRYTFAAEMIFILSKP